MLALDQGPYDFASAVNLTGELLRAFRECRTRDDIFNQMEALALEIGCKFFALIHHDDLRMPTAPRVDIKRYPEAISSRLIGQCHYRRDPVIRSCLFADGAFLWSDISRYITISRHDRRCFEEGRREGLNEGITAPSLMLGHCAGSCTFAGMREPDRANRYLGMVQMLGIFAFQAARRVIGYAPEPASPTRLHPRPRDCIVLAGRGLSNKEIARALSLTPRTVDGYLTEARRLFGVHDRTELVVSAVLAGEIGLEELRRTPDR
ncbi:LuxR family transcriptional regulator [Novosphingobium kaempferiae]|uniref:LuxR family transcriptional regulator n=1 Tax=Novosphingobium kaempferiae TaxID=2896849 RepID=UPI001E47C856|nr:LuxR family transcriptional regulator [Novosphingobium kaempferiae]